MSRVKKQNRKARRATEKTKRLYVYDVSVNDVFGQPRCRVVAMSARCALPDGHGGTHVLWTRDGILMIGELPRDPPDVEIIIDGIAKSATGYSIKQLAEAQSEFARELATRPSEDEDEDGTNGNR
jgi:hypothetical protein